MSSNIPVLSLSSQPSIEPLTLSETKSYLKISTSSDDVIISGLITSARKMAEAFLTSSLITQSWKISYNKYAPSCVKLVMGPVQSISSVIAVARDGSQQVISSSTYYLVAGNYRLIFDASPISHRIEITYVTGYGNTAASVPAPIRYGMLAHIAAMYDGRMGEKSLPKQAAEFYLPYRGSRY